MISRSSEASTRAAPAHFDTACRHVEWRPRHHKNVDYHPKTRSSQSVPPLDFSAAPRGMKGRSGELSTLARTILATRPTRIALIGPGGSGKSMLAAALGHRLADSVRRPRRLVPLREPGASTP